MGWDTSDHENGISVSAAANPGRKQAPSNRGSSPRLGRAAVDVGERFSAPGFTDLGPQAGEAISRAWVGICSISSQRS